MARSAQIPTTVIGGFLGAGKTTLLNALIRGETDRRLGVLVNDFGTINIDADLVVGVEDNLISLGGGCICCSIREDLTRSIIEMTQRVDAPDHLIVEASGVSDPAAIARAISASHLRDVVSLDAVVVVVDAEAYLRAGLRERVVTAGQLKAADVVVLSKVDLLEPAELEAARAKVRKRLPRARVVAAERGKVPPALLLGIHSERIPEAGSFAVRLQPADNGEPEEDHTAAFATWSYTTDVALSARKLKRVVDRLPPTVFRAKGVVQLAGERTHRAVLHVAGRRAELELGLPWGDAKPQSKLVFIGAQGSLDPGSLAQSLAECEAPPGERRGGMMRWLRGALQGQT
ncbi:MAG: GTP-binding protein [Myxococcota bacterium]